MSLLKRYDYKGWARYTLSSLLEQEEEMNDSERKRRIEGERGFRQEHLVAANAQYELKDAQNRLRNEAVRHDELRRALEASKRDLDVKVTQQKELVRDKRELQLKVSLLTEDIRGYELQASKHRSEVAALEGSLSLY